LLFITSDYDWLINSGMNTGTVLSLDLFEDMKLQDSIFQGKYIILALSTKQEAQLFYIRTDYDIGKASYS
jgi:hypothetical protein